MKAVILAAGQGTRLRPLTDDIPKCLVPYHGKPILEHALTALRAAGVYSTILVVGYKRAVLEKYGLPMYYNPDFASTNMVASLFCAEPEFDDDLIVSYGDIVYRQEIVEALIADGHDFSVIVDRKWHELWRQRMDDPLQDAETLRLESGGIIRELGKKPKSLSEIQGQYIGLFRVKKAALAEVCRFYHSLDQSIAYDGKPFEQMFMTTFIQLIIDQLMPVYAVPIDGGWVEIDSVVDLDSRMV